MKKDKLKFLNRLNIGGEPSTGSLRSRDENNLIELSQSATHTNGVAAKNELEGNANELEQSSSSSASIHSQQELVGFTPAPVQMSEAGGLAATGGEHDGIDLAASSNFAFKQN